MTRAPASPPPPTRRSWPAARLAVIVVLFGTAAFVAGTRVVWVRRAVPVDSITGRQIAGIATDRQWLDRPARATEEDPDRALDLIGIAPGSVVADIGAGTGYMTVKIAPRVGAGGKVYANELQPAMLAIIQQKVRDAHLTNVEAVHGTEDNARLPDGVVDLALLVDVYHEFSQPEAMLRSIRRSLRPGGRLVLVEYRGEDPTIPIAPTHRMSVAVARREVEAEGYVFDRVVDDLPRQHIIEFTRP